MCTTARVPNRLEFQPACLPGPSRWSGPCGLMGRFSGPVMQRRDQPRIRSRCRRRLSRRIAGSTFQDLATSNRPACSASRRLCRQRLHTSLVAIRFARAWSDSVESHDANENQNLDQCKQCVVVAESACSGEDDSEDGRKTKKSSQTVLEAVRRRFGRLPIGRGHGVSLDDGDSTVWRFSASIRPRRRAWQPTGVAVNRRPEEGRKTARRRTRHDHEARWDR